VATITPGQVGNLTYQGSNDGITRSWGQQEFAGGEMKIFQAAPEEVMPWQNMLIRSLEWPLRHNNMQIKPLCQDES
jgi:hypothetical protein